MVASPSPILPGAGRSTRLALLAALAALGVGTACKDSNEPPTLRIPRASLNGDYVCTRMLAYLDGPQGLGWYTGNCNAYISVTNPSRRDSIETFPFEIRIDDSVFRIDFPEGTLQYDSLDFEAVVSYAELDPDIYHVGIEGGRIVLEQVFQPFDFSGDGAADSLVLTFTRQ
jgi:hypothetical protein